MNICRGRFRYLTKLEEAKYPLIHIGLAIWIDCDLGFGSENQRVNIACFFSSVT